MAVKHIRKQGSECWCGETKVDGAPALIDDPGDPKASKKCLKAYGKRHNHRRSLAIQAVAGKPVSPAVAERLYAIGDDVRSLRTKVEKDLAQ